jgi:hypothetical protein
MGVQISPFLTLSQQYSSLMSAWSGDLLVRTVHAPKSYRVLAGDILDLTEVGVLICWRGDEPTGVFLPWSEIISIEQTATIA